MIRVTKKRMRTFQISWTKHNITSSPQLRIHLELASHFAGFTRYRFTPPAGSIQAPQAPKTSISKPSSSSNSIRPDDTINNVSSGSNHCPLGEPNPILRNHGPVHKS